MSKADDEFDAKFYEATGIILGSGTIQAVRNFVAAREAAAAEQAWKEGYVNACGTFIGSTEGDAREAAEKGWAINSHNYISFDALARALDRARTEERKACLDIVSKRAASRFNEATHCLSDRSRKHMQIRADEAGQIAALIRARGNEVADD